MGYLEIIMKKTQGPNLTKTREDRPPKINMKSAMKAGLKYLTKDVK